ncbi:hypothetical protein C1645_825227 [Glomus cerebriforme]|uniref:Uncharacterized protein n=1 Tax=Glomus cerebriforme TaxID=658196 RepID=A0A397ST21_9GLOM|nr:hypothetical protein C1645_825227 [Glomus cerebriforme]
MNIASKDISFRTHENMQKVIQEDTSSQDSESSDFYIKIYESVHLENGKILRTSGEFQVTPAEDQEIQYGSDEGAWYGKELSKEPYELALVRWYDIK